MTQPTGGRVWAVAHTKGGPGKTTLALQIALGMLARGLRVWLVDGDEQQSAMKALGFRPEGLPTLPAAAYAEGKTLLAQVTEQRGQYDLVVIDTGGRNSRALRAALNVADLALVPFNPSAFELWAHEEIGPEIDEASAPNVYRPHALDVRAVVNCADPDPKSPDNLGCREVIEATGHYRLLTTQIVKRKALARASAQGVAIGAYSPRDALAAAEIAALITELEQD
jgi:chromosome partitioning protein